MTVVGQAPGPNTDPAEPLSGASGRRLAALCGSAFPFERVNVLDAWPGRCGKGDAFPKPVRSPLVRSLAAGGADHRVVLLGRSVASLFGLAAVPWFEWRGRFVVVPHPSGISHWWNDPANVERARRFWWALAR